MFPITLVPNPLEQFEVMYVSSLTTLGVVDLSLTNAILISFFFYSILFFLFEFSLKPNWLYLRTSLSFALIKLFFFLKSLIKDNVKSNIMGLYPLLFLLFLFLLGHNLIGMVPYSFTVTAHLVVTLTLSLSFFIGLNTLGIIKNGFTFLSLFLPHGSPLVMAPFLIVIELISYFARIFSLAIRLFANLMSGHTLLKILAGFSWSMLLYQGVGFIGGLFPLLIIFVVTGLELSIAGLQAYVFLILICIYIEDAVNLH